MAHHRRGLRRLLDDDALLVVVDPEQCVVRLDDLWRSRTEEYGRRLDANELVFAPEGADEASVRVEARREGDRWTSQPALRDGAAGDLVATLAHLKAGVILADASGEAELVGLGLAPATTRIRVLGRPGAPDDSPKVLAEVLLGHFDPRRGIVAMRPGRDEVFRLEPSLIESLPRDSADFESRFVAPAEATEEPVAEEAAD